MNIPFPHFDTLPETPLESHWILYDASALVPGGRGLARIQSPEYSYLPEASIAANTDKPGPFATITREQEIAAVGCIREEDLSYKEAGINVLRRGLISYFEAIAVICPERAMEAREAVRILLNPFPTK